MELFLDRQDLLEEVSSKPGPTVEWYDFNGPAIMALLLVRSGMYRDEAGMLWLIQVPPGAKIQANVALDLENEDVERMVSVRAGG